MPDNGHANDEYSGLWEKVQTPGKVIYVATGKEAGLSLARERTYQSTNSGTGYP